MIQPGKIKPHLDNLLAKFDKSFLAPDPLAAVNHFTSRDDLETACLIAALFAYGRADLIQRNVAAIIGSMGKSPARFCEKFRPGTNAGWMKGFVYRFHRRDDLVSLVTAIKKARSKNGSLLKLFLANDNPSADTILPGLNGMVSALRSYSGRDTQAYRTLLSDPSAGGASKRWCLFLRWMVRKDDVDPGPWSGKVSRARLVIPLDTHVSRIARQLGMVKRKSNDWKTALELTSFLRRLDPDDPVKYDFAICSYGKLGYCVKNRRQDQCENCDLDPVCSHGKI
ncbi:hypothetical protein MNBD_NITROSPINAE03-1545 [hydrothermal vent metagenome]|uniref:TIGR02757 family protein n=1 Tax=hydrothermal vent metagenome TaxID=652676 RepID=A0A3B1CHT8_9ZZZZ